MGGCQVALGVREIEGEKDEVSEFGGRATPLLGVLGGAGAAVRYVICLADSTGPPAIGKLHNQHSPLGSADSKF